MLRARRAMAAGLFDQRQYWQAAKAIQPANLMFLLPLDDAGVGNARELSGNNLVVPYSAAGISYRQTGPASGMKAITGDGTNCYVGLYSAALNTLFGNGQELTIAIFAAVANWGTATQMNAIQLGADSGSNLIAIDEKTGSNTISIEYVAGGTRVFTNIAYAGTETGFYHYVATVSKSNNRFRAFVNGSQQGADQAVAGTWSGALSTSYTGIAGRRTGAASLPWGGGLAMAIGWNAELSPEEVAILASPFSYSPVGIFPVGDSKTASATAGINALLTALRASTGQNWVEMPYRLGVSGLDTATFKTRIDADMAAVSAAVKPYVRHIMYNMGANDNNSTPIHDDFYDDTEYCLLALHTAFPNAVIRMAKVWERGDQTWLTTIQHVVVDELTAAYDWIQAGIDEVVILEAGDDGATWTSEGTHPTNPAGYIREWTADSISWKAAMGY